jgi:hypothetical protein
MPTTKIDPSEALARLRLPDPLPPIQGRPVAGTNYMVTFNPEAAAAAHSQFAIPAQEQTKQEQERTKQSRYATIRYTLGGSVVGGLTLASLHTPALAWPLVALSGVVVGATNAPEILRQIGAMLHRGADSKAIVPVRSEDKSRPGETSQ